MGQNSKWLFLGQLNLVKNSIILAQKSSIQFCNELFNGIHEYLILKHKYPTSFFES